MLGFRCLSPLFRLIFSPILSLRFFSFFGFSPSFFSVSRFSPPFRFLLHLFSVLRSIYRAKGVAFYCSHGEQPAGRPLGATAKVRLPPVFWQVHGGWSANVFGRWAPGERGPDEIQTKAPFSFFPAAMFGGEEERGTVSFKTTPFCFFFFLMYETASFWRKRAVSFICGARTRQCSNQPSIIFCSFQLHPCQIRSPPLLLAAFFTLVLGL